MEGLSRRERERLNRRNEILQASWKVFASKDYDSATLDDIAEAAEISKGTIYLYFKNKADLFISTLEIGIEKLSSIIGEVIASNDDPVTGVKEIIKRQMDFCEENLDFFKILFSERSHFEVHSRTADRRDLKKHAKSLLLQNVDTLADYIQRGIDIGVFRKVDPKDASFLLLSIIHGFATGAIVYPKKFKLPQKAEVITTIFLKGLEAH